MGQVRLGNQLNLVFLKEPLLFFVFINDLPEHLVFNPNSLADDVSLNAMMYGKIFNWKHWTWFKIDTWLAC